MENNNQPPFRAGQKIVRIGESSLFIKKGVTYTCESCDRCPRCGHWGVSVREYSDESFAGSLACTGCSSLTAKNAYDSRKFAPLVDNYTDCRSELIEKAMQADGVSEVDVKRPITVSQT